MPNEAYYLDITLLGKEYRVACPPEEQPALLAAVAYVDEKMHDIAEKTKSNISERIAVMAALNIAHDLQMLKDGREKSDAVVGRSLGEMNRKLDDLFDNLPR